MAEVKICGLRAPAHVAASIEAGARYLGFVFYPGSPRAVTPAEARALLGDIPVGVAKVGLFVDPDDALLDEVLSAAALDVIQLHGRETPERVAEVKALTGLPVMKAVGLSGAAELPSLVEYGLVADMLLVDAKPPTGVDLPGGNGLAFDWRLLIARRWLRPWMLAGGLNAQNVAEAVRVTGASVVDVSSGVESRPGEKDVALIRKFVAAARGGN